MASFFQTLAELIGKAIDPAAGDTLPPAPEVIQNLGDWLDRLKETRFPGIQLGFGFKLTGIVGMVGINRRADVDQLASRLASGAAGNVLFCEDPVHNAPALFNDLAAFFPPADGVFILGPTVQLGWLFIVRMDLGVLIELPGPSHILIVGSARATIPGLGSAVPLVNLRTR
jgi:hypothetical protein